MNELPIQPVQGEARTVLPVAASELRGIQRPRGEEREGERATGPNEKASEEAALEPLDLEQITAELNAAVPPERGIRFEIAAEGDDLMVQVVNLESDEVIRSIPSERLVHFREDFRELTGLLLDDRV